MQKPRLRSLIVLVLLALAASSIACNAAALSRLSPPGPPSPGVEGSADALNSFNEKWRELNLATPGGPFSVTFTEAELTSAVQAALAEAQADTGQSFPVENVQVALRNGSVDVYGQIRVDPLTANAEVNVVPYIGSNGNVELEITRAAFGMFEVDQSVINGVLNSVERSINQPIHASPANISLTDVAVSDGQLTVNGTINP